MKQLFHRLHSEEGVTLVELLVSMLLFSVVGLSVVGFMSTTFFRLGAENRASLASLGLKNALELISNELRSSSAVSPYIPGTDPSIVNCGAQISASATTLRFLVVHDDAAVANGIRAYYVGYRYDASTKELLRGQITASSTTNCLLPAGDPTAAGTAEVLATDIIQIDGDSNGTLDPVFAYTAPVLTMNVGIQINAGKGIVRQQKLSTKVNVRSL